MSTDLTGIQTTALHGLLSDQGISAPDITALLTEYETLGGVFARKSVAVNEVPLSTAVATFNGYDPTSGGSGTSDWTSSGTYTGIEYVRRNGKMYQSIAYSDSLDPKDPATEPSYWTEQTNSAYTVFNPPYIFSIPSWITISMLVVTVNNSPKILNTDYTLSSDFTKLTLVIPPLTTDTVVVAISPRTIFYRLCEDFPAAIGVIPQNFVANLGNGMLIDTTYARTVNMFGGVGARKFGSLLGQAQGWAQQSKSIAKSSAQASFGSANNPAAGATGGFTKLAGNSEKNLKTVGTALKNSGSLINIQKPWISYSALGLLYYLAQKGSQIVGNMHVKVFGQSFQDPATGQQVTISDAWVSEKITASSAESPLYQTSTDQALVQLISRSLDSSDVAAIKNLLSTTVNANTFQDLMNYQKIWGSPTDANSATGMVLSTTGKSELITAISDTIASEMKMKPDTSATSMGSAMMKMQPVEGAQLNALTKPSTQSQFDAILAYSGKGSGDNGAITCSDALGETNYKEVLQQTIAALRQLNSDLLKKINTDLTAVWYASDPPPVEEGEEPITISDVVLSDGSTGYADWASLIVRVKNLTDTSSRSLKTQIQNIGKAALLKPYNTLAETHSTSVHVYTTVPFYETVGDKSTVVNFVNQLPGLGKNLDGFNAQKLIENCCQDNVTGQAIAGAMREGRNADLLAQANIDTDANSDSANPLPVSESAPGLVGGGQWPQPTDPYASKPSSSTGF